MLKLRQFYTLTVLTAVESIKQPICLLLAAACYLLTAMTPLLLMHHFGEDGKLARDSGLALHFLFGLFIACYTASSCLDREMRKGTASAVLSKPIGRDTFFLAKFAGTVLVILLFSFGASMATLLSERVSMKFTMEPGLVGYITDNQTGALLIAAPFVAFVIAGLINYLARRPFESTAFILLLCSVATVMIVSGFFNRSGDWSPYDLRIHEGIIPVSLMVTLALIVISSIAITLSSRLSIVPTLMICSSIFLLGMMSDYLFGKKAMESVFVMVVYRLIPDWQNFWTVDALSEGGTVPWRYVLHASGYAFSYTTGILLLGLVSFNSKEMR
ncbi:hypothetical protein BVX97_06200 [bacterium E08(2017)]|nr:hypothetical protein BVX97_06200 [bacterium E08(2017)]